MALLKSHNPFPHHKTLLLCVFVVSKSELRVAQLKYKLDGCSPLRVSQTGLRVGMEVDFYSELTAILFPEFRI